MLMMLKCCCCLAASLLLTICVGVDVTTAPTCEAVGKSSSAPECASAPGEVLLQRGHKAKKSEQHAAVVTEEESEKKYQLRTIDHHVVQGLSRNAAVREISVAKSPDAKTATVTFEHRGTKFNHELSLVSVYSDGATVKRHTSTGEVRVDASSLQSRRFRSDQRGRRASATLHEDGSVSGFFEDAGKVVRVDPAARHNASEIASLMQEFRGRGIGHVVEFIAMPELGNNARQRGRNASTLTTLSTGGDDFEVAVDKESPIVGSDQAEDDFLLEMKRGDWTGQAWFPGCYTGDSAPHTMKVKVIGDNALYGRYGRGTRDAMEEAVFSSSFIYQMQMNFILQVEALEVYESYSRSAPDFAFGCFEHSTSGKDMMEDKLSSLFNTLNANRGSIVGATTHLITGCGNGHGIVGIAYVGTGCLTRSHELPYGSGVDQLPNARYWATYAHELGHNLGAHHTFEEGQGRTGGIMDYGDGTLDGEYQFNTKYRKDEVCGLLNKAVQSGCRGYFTGGDPTPSPTMSGATPTPSPTPAPTPSPTPAPTVPCKDNENWRSWWGYPCSDFSSGWCWRWDVSHHCLKLCGYC